MSSDTEEKRKKREDARRLLDLLRNHWVENGKRPELAFSPGALGCAKLGSKFLDLAENGEHYSSKKCSRTEMIKKRKDLGDPMFMGHLAEYEDL